MIRDLEVTKSVAFNSHVYWKHANNAFNEEAIVARLLLCKKKNAFIKLPPTCMCIPSHWGFSDVHLGLIALYPKFYHKIALAALIWYPWHNVLLSETKQQNPGRLHFLFS